MSPSSSSSLASPAAGPGATAKPAVEVEDIVHAYGKRTALAGVSFDVAQGELFALLGPNGGGKTTLFRILATLFPPDSGTARILGHDIRRDTRALRRRVGVVFQAPALDTRLTVQENLRHQAHLYGLGGREMNRIIEETIGRFDLGDRRKDLVMTLSGGLKRRVELARALLHGPELLLLDEPSTGLDPGVRREFWRHLDTLRAERHVTVLLTTHLMDEADNCDRVGIIDAGHLVALDTPGSLKSCVGGDVVSVRGREPDALQREIESRFGGAVTLVEGTLRTERERGAEFAAALAEAFPGRFDSMTVSRPTLEDVFIHLTGRRFE